MTDDPLEQLLTRLTEDASILLASEDVTKQGAILPILVRLGWDRENVREVVPEHRVPSGGRVDYCLRIRDKNCVFIEAKKVDQELEKHQEQLLEYAFREGVELAALTNGLLWWLYLPLLGGSWEQRKFFTIDIPQQGAGAAAEHFRAYLGKNEVGSGSAVRRATELHRSREKERLALATLPKAWQLLSEGPDETLLDLIAARVESLSGHRPTPEQMARFLQAITAPQPGPLPESSQQHGSSIVGPDVASGFTFTRPTSFTLFGIKHRVSSWRDVLVGVCEAIAAKHPQEFERVLQIKGRKRDYFSRDLRDMHSPALIQGSGIFVETNLSANATVERCGQIFRLFGYSPDGLLIDTQPLR